MLRIVHGNRAESMLSALLGALPALDPFAPHTIVVGSHLITRWLQREIAIARGIAAGLELVTFDRFIDRTFAGDDAARAAGITALDRGQLEAVIASVLADDAIVSRLPSVRAYLAAAPAGGDHAAPRRVQLAYRISELAWQYATTRTEWMPALLAGRVPNDIAEHGDAALQHDAKWQATLIGAAFDRLQRAVPAKRFAMIPILPQLRKRMELPPPKLAPISVFGTSFLPRSQLEALTALAETTSVTVYLLDPCRELWDDVAARGTEPAQDPLPLVLWGRPVRDTIAALVERSGGDVDDAFVDPIGETARERLLADVLDRRVPSGTIVRDAGVVVLACPNPRREIEVVADEARRRLDADPTLRAHEIAVWIAGPDAARYLAQACSAFEAVGVPCHLIDAPIDDRGRIGEATLSLLELPGSAMRRSDLLRVLTHPAVLARYPHVDADDWVRWTDRLGIVHGADDEDHAGTYLEDHHGHFHWDQGVRRLALGAFMVGHDRGPVQITHPKHGRMHVAPEPIRPEHQASAATFALLVRSLCADAAWLESHEAPLAMWAEILVGLVDTYLAARSEEAARDLERVKSILAGLSRIDLDRRPIGFREAREYAVRLIESACSNRGEPFASGVMVAPVGAMRAVPARVTFVVGLDEGALPAGDRPSPLDLRITARPGDVSPRDRDRHAFLELVLGARDGLYLSYVAIEEKSGSPLGPSSVVLELADALAPYLGAVQGVSAIGGAIGSSREALAAMTVRHPLHRFIGELRGVTPAVARERWAITVRDAIRDHLRAHDHPVPDEDGMLQLLADPSQATLRDALALVDPPQASPPTFAPRPVTIASLRLFLESPIQAWAQAVLGLDEIDDDAEIDLSDEPFVIDKPLRALLVRDVLAAWLADPAKGCPVHYDAAVSDLQLRGQYPVGVFAEAARARDIALLTKWREQLGAIGGVTRYGFGRASAAGAELLPALELALAPNRVIRLTGQTEILIDIGRRTSVIPMLREADGKTRYHLRGAFDHAVLAAAGLAPNGHKHVLLDKEGAAKWVEHSVWPAEEARSFLVSLCRELLDDSHGYLLPFECLVKALGGEFPKLPRRGTDKGGGALGFGPIDRSDGLALPRSALAIAQRRLRPLFRRMTGNHSFEIDS